MNKVILCNWSLGPGEDGLTRGGGRGGGGGKSGIKRSLLSRARNRLLRPLAWTRREIGKEGSKRDLFFQAVSRSWGWYNCWECSDRNQLSDLLSQRPTTNGFFKRNVLGNSKKKSLWENGGRWMGRRRPDGCPCNKVRSHTTKRETPLDMEKFTALKNGYMSLGLPRNTAKMRPCWDHIAILSPSTCSQSKFFWCKMLVNSCLHQCRPHLALSSVCTFVPPTFYHWKYKLQQCGNTDRVSFFPSSLNLALCSADGNAVSQFSLLFSPQYPQHVT